MAKTTALAATTAETNVPVSSRETQSRNFKNLMLEVKSLILKRVADDLRWNYKVGRLIAAPLGIVRDKNGSLIKDAVSSYSTYGGQTIATIAAAQGVKSGFIQSRINFFIKFHPDIVEKMAGSVISSGSSMFPWKTVQVLMSLPSDDDRAALVDKAIKRSLPPATIVSQASVIRSSFRGKEKKRSTTTTANGTAKKGGQGRKVSPAIDACDAFVRFGKCLKEITTRVPLVDAGLDLLAGLSKRDTKLRPHAERELANVKKLLDKLLPRLKKAQGAVNSSFKRGKK